MSKITTISLRAETEWVSWIDAFIKRQPFPITRSDLIRAAVDSYIEGGDFERKAKKSKVRAPALEEAVAHGDS